MSDVEAIKQRLDIADVVSSYIKLIPAGQNFKTNCPFHHEKTPSCFISPERQSFYCFGCSAHGDIFSFVEQYEGVDFTGALKILADKAGVKLSGIGKGENDAGKKLFMLLADTTTFFEEKLGANSAAKKYLVERGVSQETISDWQIGYAPDAWRELLEHLSSKGYSEEEMLNAGVVKKAQSESATKLYDVFRDRIIFPLRDNSGRVVGFSGRLLKESDKQPKYVNSPETALFNKSGILFGFSRAKPTIRKTDFVILVEGQFDVVLLHQAGFTNAVAVSGTALTSTHLDHLARHSKRMVMAYDSDSAGFEATLRGVKVALSKGFDVRIVALPEGDDPADIISKDKEMWRGYQKGAKPFIAYYVDHLQSHSRPGPSMVRSVSDKVLPFVAALPSEMERAQAVSHIAKSLLVSEDAVRADLSKAEAIKVEEYPDVSNPLTEAVPQTRKDSIIKRIQGIIHWQDSAKDKKVNVDVYKKKLDELLGGIAEMAEEDRGVAIFEAERFTLRLENLDQHLEELFLNLEVEVLQEKFTDLQRRLSISEKESGNGTAENLLTECHDISMKLSTLRQTLHKTL